VYGVWNVNRDVADPFYVDQFLRLPRTLAEYSRFASGVVNRRRSIRKQDLLSIKIPLPPLPEQRAIARVLRTVQEAIEATERAIEAAEELKRSMMEYLFTYGPVPIDQAEKVELQNTATGPIPAHWNARRLGDLISKPQYGVTASAVEDTVGPHLLRITDITDDGVEWSRVPYCVIEKRDLAKHALEVDDLLIARIGATTGKSFRVDEEPPTAVFASYLIRVRPGDKELDPEYLSDFAQSSRYWAQINASKGGRLKQWINIPVLRQLEIPVPPESQQTSIAAQLRAVDLVASSLSTARYTGATKAASRLALTQASGLDWAWDRMSTELAPAAGAGEDT
jgi:type I restriction enzyme S subunit